MPKKNVVMESFKFNSLKQDSEQGIYSFITVLRTQAGLCEFKCESCQASYETRMIRDKLVLSISDNEVQERLLREGDLKLEKVQSYCKSIELSKEHVRLLNQTSTSNIDTHALKNRKLKCKFCGYEHEKGKCPAYNKSCMKCKKRGHYAKM